MEMGKLIDLYVTSRNGIPVIRNISCNLRLSIYLVIWLPRMFFSYLEDTME